MIKAELIAEGLIPLPAPPRDLGAEIDGLKGRLEKLERGR